MTKNRILKQSTIAWVCVTLLFGVLCTGACGGVTPAAPTAAPEVTGASPSPTPPPAGQEAVIMTTGEWAPFTSESMEGYGFFTEIVTAVFEEMGRPPQYEFYPWQRAEQAIRDGNAWAAFPYSYNEERAQTFAFSDAVADSTTVFFYYKPHMEAIEWEDLADLKPYRIGGVLGYFYEEPLEEAGLTTDYVGSEDLALQKLQAGRVDLVPMTPLVAWIQINTLFPEEVDNFGTLEKPLAETTLHLMIRKDDASAVQLMEQFNAALQAIKEKGAYQEILARYGMTE